LTNYNRVVLGRIYQSQKKYFDSNVSNKADYSPIINFASKGRFKLYKKNSITINSYNKTIILEGIHNSSGMYVGLMFCDTDIYYYKNNTLSGWKFSKVTNDINLEDATGIREGIINIVSVWDTIHINKLKQQVGSTVTDEFSFIASRINYINKSIPFIETIGFYEFK
jgi:hypothetical protein